MKLLIFEWKKFIRNTKNIIIIGLMFFIILTVCLIERQQLIVEKEEIFLEDSFIHQQLLNDMEEIQKQKKNSSLLMDNYLIAMDAIENKVKYSTPEDWKRSLTEENIFIETVKEIQKMDMLSNISDERLSGKSENDFYLKNSIKPDNSLYGVSAMYYVRIILVLVFSIYGYLFFLLLFYDIYSREREKKNLNWLVTLPVPYKKFTKSKTILSLIVVVLVIVIGLLFTYILGAFLSQRVGEINYPVEFRVTNEVLESLSFTKYFFMSFTAFVLMILLMLQLLSMSLKLKINSEKVLLFSIVSLVTISQFTRLLESDLRCFTVIHYINLSTTVTSLYSNNLLFYYVISTSILFFLTIYLLKPFPKKVI